MALGDPLPASTWGDLPLTGGADAAYCSRDLEPSCAPFRLFSFTRLLAMPLVMPKSCAAVAVAVLLVAGGCSSLELNPTNWQMPSLASEEAPPGTAQWWKKHKNKAEFVVGKGWRVPGYEDFYDDQGRPIRAKVAKVVKQEKAKKDALLEDVEVIESVAKFKEQFGLGPDQRIAEQTYAEGETLFRAQKFAEATKKFKEAASRWPDSRLQQDAMFYQAESEFYNRQYSEAVDAYEKLLENYPSSPHLDQVIRRQFEIAQYWEKHHQWQPHWATTPNLLDETRPLFDTLGHALKTYENIRLNDPTGPLADDAIMASANSYFLRGRYGDADYQYELLRNEYPRSEHQFEAHILGLQCKLRKYQGANYDETPLLEAKQLVKQLKVQFAGQLNSEERARQSEIEGPTQPAVGRTRLSHGQVLRKRRALRQRQVLLRAADPRLSRDTPGGAVARALPGAGRKARSSGVEDGLADRPLSGKCRAKVDRPGAIGHARESAAHCHRSQRRRPCRWPNHSPLTSPRCERSRCAACS